jgi:methionine synthase II (cobalamin-independent)
MEKDKKIKNDKNLFVIHSEEINKAYERAVREAVRKHKQAGNSVVTSRDGEVVILRSSDIIL